MKLNRLLSKALACAVALTLLAPTAFTPAHVYAADFSDISGHWAEKYIKSAISKGIVKGYSDGTFKPDKAVTRAEFASMVNKALGNTGTASISFHDVPSSEWYYSDISKAVAATYVAGYDDSSFKPNNPITREEASVIISRIVPSYGASGNLRSFGDYSSISSWALTAMQKSNGKGYIGAYDDGNIHPQDKLTRAQTAKIIGDITEKETIVTDAPVVKTSGTTLSNKIYSNGVTIHKDLAESNATIDNCIVLGNLSIQGGGSNSVVISNSRVSDCSVAKSISSVRVVAKGETCILNTNVSNTAKLETSGLAGGDTGVGFNKVNANGSSDLTLSGSFPKVNVIGSSANVKLESGTISNLDVSSSARNSKITVDSNGTVSTANVNSAVSFHGTGNVQRMNANANDITYEKKPSDLNIGSGVSTKPVETNAALSITFDPADGAKNVAVDKKITITFTQSMTKYNGKEILNSDLDDLIELTKESKSGTAVSFSATINSSKKVITITPDKSLTVDTKYYITIDRNVFKDANGDGNAAQSIYFTAGTGTIDGVTFYPANSATGIKTSIEPTITFDNAIETYSGDDITAKYLKNNITFRKSSSSGSDVSFTASINSKSKVITITPSSALTSGQKYYIGFASRVFRTDSDDKNISGQNVTWTVGSTTTPTMTFNPVNGTTGFSAGSNISVTFSERIFNSSGSVPSSSNVASAVTFRDNTSNVNIPYSATVSDYNSSSIFTLDPTNNLTAGHNYTVTVAASYFKNSSGNFATSATTNFTVLNNTDVTVINTAITRANNAMANVAQSSSNGTDVFNTIYWVTPSQWTTLSNAITTATNAKSTVQTAAAASTAASTLDAATTTFEQSKKLGLKVKVDTTVIDNEIGSANTHKSGIEISNDGTDVDASKQWVTSLQMSALDNAITTATQAKATVLTAEAANAAAATLNTAISTFDSQKSYGTKVIINKSSLASAINAANSLKNSTSSSSDGTDIATDKYWVTSDVLSTYGADIAAAEAVLAKTSATQTEVDDAESALTGASANFLAARQPGSIAP